MTTPVKQPEEKAVESVSDVPVFSGELQQHPGPGYTWGEACTALCNGKKIAKPDWPSGHYIVLKDDYLRYHKDGTFHLLKVRAVDMLAEDYFIIG